jgi:N-ethylmaleimide reductase
MQSISRRTVTKGALGSVVALALGGAHSAEVTPDSPLFKPFKFGAIEVRNRFVMAPMTRGRAGAIRTANSLMAEYYGQRASAGLIVTEATAISPMGYGWLHSPGIYTPEHVAGWKGVTSAVRARGGKIVLQLWHMGRVSHPDYLNGATPVAPSAIAAAGETYTPSGKKPYVTPRELTTSEIAATVRDYAQATVRAREAGFDGVEIHAANGYLIDQFIRDSANRRTDRYGGSVSNRLRFLREVTEAVTGAWSPDRTGVRLSPTNPYNDMRDSDAAGTFTAAARALDEFGLAYLHVVEAPPARIAASMRAAFKNALILNENYDASTGADALASGAADAIAYGRHFLANPDLVERFRRNERLNAPDFNTFYTEGAKGYTDYPAVG